MHLTSHMIWSPAFGSSETNWQLNWQLEGSDVVFFFFGGFCSRIFLSIVFSCDAHLNSWAWQHEKTRLKLQNEKLFWRCDSIVGLFYFSRMIYFSFFENLSIEGLFMFDPHPCCRAAGIFELFLELNACISDWFPYDMGAFRCAKISMQRCICLFVCLFVCFFVLLFVCLLVCWKPVERWVFE